MKLVTIKPYSGSSYAGFKLPPEVVSTKESKISAQFEQGTSDTLRALSFEDEKKYLPNILGVSIDSPTWREATKDYWCNFMIIVPEAGLLLNIDVREDGTPENVLNFIQYNFAMKHGEVAKNKNLISWPKHKFYIVDAGEIKKEQTASFELRNRASKAFLFLQSEENKDKREWVARCLKEAGDIIPTDDQGLLLFLEAKKDKVKDGKPEGLEDFIKAVNDPDLKEKALLYRLDSEGIVEKNGNSYFYGNELLGTEKEATAWLKNPINSKYLLQMNEKLKAQTV